MSKQDDPAETLRELETQISLNQEIISTLQVSGQKLALNSGLIGMASLGLTGTVGTGLTLAGTIAAADVMLTGGLITATLIIVPSLFLGIDYLHIKCIKKINKSLERSRESILKSLPAPQELLPQPPQIKALLKLAGPSIAFNGENNEPTLKSSPQIQPFLDKPGII